MCSADKREKDEQREQDALNKAKKKSLGDEIRKASLKTMGSVIDAIRTANKRATAAVRKYKVGGGKDDDGTEKPFGGEEEDEEIVKEMQEAGGALSSVGPRHRMRPNIEAMRALKEAEVNTQNRLAEQSKRADQMMQEAREEARQSNDAMLRAVNAMTDELHEVKVELQDLTRALSRLIQHMSEKN